MNDLGLSKSVYKIKKRSGREWPAKYIYKKKWDIKEERKNGKMQWIPGSNERERRLYLSFFDPRHRQTEIYTSCSRVCVCMAKGPCHTSPMVSNDMRTLSPLGPESLGRRNRTFFRVPSAHEIHEIQKS